MKRPHFNITGLKLDRFCSEHKEEGMVDVKNNMCELLACIDYFCELQWLAGFIAIGHTYYY